MLMGSYTRIARAQHAGQERIWLIKRLDWELLDHDAWLLQEELSAPTTKILVVAPAQIEQGKVAPGVFVKQPSTT
jgi:hypothetical protein